MKTLSISTIFIILLFAGCKKDNTNNGGNPSVKTYLLKTMTKGGFNFVDTYTYDDNNRVIEINSQNTLRDYQYTYDSNNNLLTAKTYELNYSGGPYTVGSLLGSDVYSYSGNTVNVKRADGGTYKFILNNQKQVTEADFTAGESETNSYDSKGNLITTNSISTSTQSTSFTYDDKKNPLSMMGAINYHMMFLASGSPQTFVNNVTGGGSPSANISYTYNSDGFPVTSTVTGDFSATYKYDYIVK